MMRLLKIRSILFFRQILFLVRLKLTSKNNSDFNLLAKNGYVIIKNAFPAEVVNNIAAKKKHEINKNSVASSSPLTQNETEKIYSILKQKGIFDLCIKYLGRKIFTYENSYNYLGDIQSKEGSWQPHHDSKNNRLKIYI